MNWFTKHVTRDLSAHCNGELTPERSARVADHLRTCPKCRGEHEDIRLGVLLAEQLSPKPAPDSLWADISAEMTERERRQAVYAPGSNFAKRGLRWAVACAVVFLVFAGGGSEIYKRFYASNIRLSVQASPLPPFEAAVRDLHLKRLRGELTCDVATENPRELVDWIVSHSNLRGEMAVTRPTEDDGRFKPKGAVVVTINGAPTILVAYEIDRQPVTLAVVREGDVPEPPAEGWFTKSITYRPDAANRLKVLSWARAGQAYVLVSDLPNFGEQSCFLCHASPERRQAIRNMKF